MHIRILHKVFLALLLSTGCALVLMAVLVQWNLGRGFLGYVKQMEEARLDELAAQLAQQYQANGDNWNWVLRNRAWQRLTAVSGGRQPPPPPHLAGRLPEHPPPWDDALPPPQNFDSPEPPPHSFSRAGARHSAWPPGEHEGPPAGGHEGPPPPSAGLLFEMGPRISLFDVAGASVIGPARSLDGNRQRTVINVDDGAVGWLTLDPAEKVSAARDINFLRQQFWSFATIAGALLFGAALLAIALARHLTRPLGAVTAVVQQLAGGDYASRIAARGNDEIAELSKNIDTLARTLDDNQQARQRWIADISHELRTPLAIMRGELEALQDGVRPVDSLAIDSLHAEIMQLGKLVEDLHELSLSDSGALTYHMLPIDLGAVLDEAAELYRHRFASHGLAFDYPRDADEKWPICGDRQRLLQLFTNLLENSLRYTDAGGRVLIRLRRRNGHVLVEFVDTAPTVPLAVCDKLFDRLYRVDPSRSRQQGGSGLGLSICKNIADAHNANIEATPSALGGLAITLDIAMTDG